MFTKLIINTPLNQFDQLSDSINFEDIINGRKGANLVDYFDGLIPIIRTTTNYIQPNQKFQQIHYEIIKMIKVISKIEDLDFNNAMVEIYDSQYRTMKFHSDQALDLADDSYICIFSCYNECDNNNIRKLKTKNKTTNECLDITMDHNSVIIFSTETNKNHVHKIVLETKSNNKWLGITFRLSKTFIKFIDQVSYFHPTDKILRMANDEEKKEFRKSKGIENIKIGYDYPDWDYTLSISDLIPIK